MEKASLGMEGQIILSAVRLVQHATQQRRHGGNLAPSVLSLAYNMAVIF